MPQDLFATEFTKDGEVAAGSSILEREHKRTSDEKEIALSSASSSSIVSVQSKKNFKLSDCFPKIAALFGKAPKSIEVSSILSQPLTVAEELIERARGSDLSRVSPLGALQLGIERINFEARDPVGFKDNLSRRLFFSKGITKEEVGKLWENSPERKAVVEIYAMIDLSKDVGRPITFRDAFNRLYESRRSEERGALDKIAKALIGVR